MASTRRSGLAVAFVCPLFLAGFAAAEETVEGEEARLDMEEEIVVTGSRIRRKDLTTPAPVTVITREQIDQSGRFSVGDYLQLLPEQGNAMNTQVNNLPGFYTADGSTRVSLRSLGDNRTLVLVNGRRFVTAGLGSADSSGDLNSIPGAAIERIEILKDGASAIYGSDSIAGVINIITRKHFKATEMEAFGGLSSHGDGQTFGFNATTGLTADRGNALFSAGYYEQQSVWAGDRPFSVIGLLYDATNRTAIPQGSSNIPQGRFLVPVPGTAVPNPKNDSRIDLYNQLVTTYPLADSFIHDPSSALGWRPFDLAKDTYNFQFDNYDLTPSRRVSLFSTGDLDLGARARAYYEASYVNRKSEQQLAPEPVLTDADFAVVSSANYYNPFGVDLQAVRTRLTAAGNRLIQENADTFRGVAGIDGTVPHEFGPLAGWFWDVSLNYSHSAAVTVTTGVHNPEHMPAALGPTWLDSFGKPRCGTDAANEPSGCVPLDILHGSPALTPDQAAYVLYTGTNRGINQLTQIQINTSGELFRLAADRPIGLAAGYDYRLLYGAFTPDPILVDEGADVTKGGYHVNEGYAELSLPILSGAPFAEAVEAMAAGRVFNYSTVGSGTTYKVGGRWSLARSFTVRGTYSTAFRAPSLVELFTPQHVNEAIVIDPCSGAPIPIDPSSPLGKACGPAINNGEFETAYLLTSGGNLWLKPETAKIYTLGMVFEPGTARNLSLTVDYYNIAIPDAISTTGPYVILSRCYPASAGAVPKLCDLITRDPQTHLITGIRDVQANIGTTRTDGIDIALRYTLPTPLGRFGLLFDATWLHRFDLELASGSVLHGRGNYDLGVNPALKFNAGGTWALANVKVALNTRFVSGFKECGNPQDGLIGEGSFCSDDQSVRRRVHAYNSWDLHASYSLGTAYGKTTFSAGVNNLFNTPPPTIYTAFWPTSDPTAYDFIGRFVYARVAHRFE